jgi:hypothetical protein
MAKNNTLWMVVFLGIALLAFVIAYFVFEVAIRAPEGLVPILALGLGAVAQKSTRLLCELCLRNPAGESGLCQHCEHRTEKKERIIKTRKRRKQYLDE